MSIQQLPTELIPLLEETCDGNLNNFEVTVHGDNASGLGYFGEMVCTYYSYFQNFLLPFLNYWH